ncbi:hypothetical protein CQW23_25282 [Capsicum baccatum]|uniref:Pentatricopeptide repeat-containing protein n=1 Tax=Capsicum baccatum TaxID=33114 RepID=A0A2G2VKH3_CAPBA|nr:hypothetical protein CQW23_25282 [Capsicum baccatum]
MGVVPLVLKACAALSLVSLGKALHAESVKSRFDYNVMVGTSLLDLNGKCGEIRSARKVFDYMPERNLITWNAMVWGYMKSGDVKTAFLLFENMSEKTIVTWNEMIYGNGDMDAARELFEMMPRRNFYVWSSMISGYFKKGDVKSAKDAGLEPDEVTVVSVLSACAQLALLEVGKDIHKMIIRKGIELNQYVLNGLVDMYAKCGDLGNTKLIFEGMKVKNDAPWNSLISGFANHGHCVEAINFFERMDSSGVKPNDITFLSVLSACAHAGFVEEGLEIFPGWRNMQTPSIKHYGCLVDLLGRAGRLKEACDLIKGMPVTPNKTVLGALLGACWVHSDTNVMEKLLKDFGDDAHYVILSNICAAAERWEKS